jgi:hypothetical protein
MSIKIVVPYFCVLREGYYVIIWLIVRICVFIKDWKLIYSELFILKRKRMENWGGCSWHKQYSMHLPVKRTCFFLSCTSARSVSKVRKVYRQFFFIVPQYMNITTMFFYIKTAIFLLFQLVVQSSRGTKSPRKRFTLPVHSLKNYGPLNSQPTGKGEK